MSSPFHAVARGLRVAHIGYLLTCWAAASATGIGWFWDKLYYDSGLRLTIIIAFWSAIAAGVGGVVVGIIGRVRCLATPPDFPAVRGRAIAAVVLEGSGWLSSFVGVAIVFAMGYKLLPSEPLVPVIGLIISAVLLLCGRILFLRFLRVLSRVVEDKSAGRLARLSLILFLTDWAVGLVGLGVSATGSVLRIYELTTPVVTVLWIAAGMSGLAGLILYDRLLGRLARSVQAFADTHPADEEERRYRARVAEEEDADPQAEPVEED